LIIDHFISNRASSKMIAAKSAGSQTVRPPPPHPTYLHVVMLVDVGPLAKR
jgi:hypothetical protein